ncbi:MJ0042-type zinc finger domain-containing protein [Qipengyuania sp. DGS5-3]|uniref:MJ0042-type zinc finger domain-containing protein n=1 Tax=Qipengyuania sp. DGS5-3 TaxID=3349632 RepID=UPI0036D23C10
MIIACPACNTRYVVPDSAIGVDGRTVRCAKCKHSWYQDGPEIEVPESAKTASATSAPASEPARETPPPPPPPPAPVQDPAPEPETAPAEVSEAQTEPPVSEPAENAAPSADDYGYQDAEPDFSEQIDTPAPEPEPAPKPAVYDDSDYADHDVSQFDYEPPFKPRRNILKYWTWAAAIFAVLALATVGAVQYFGMPSWAPFKQSLWGSAQPDLEIQFPVDQQERRTLPDGTEYFGARITITNTARETRALPNLLIVLRDGRERKVFDWVVVPPQNELAPGEVITINEATTQIPRAAVFADIGWAPN